MSRPARGGASYRAVLTLPHARSLIAAALLTRLSYGLLSLPLLLALQKSTGSYTAAGTATGLFGLAAAVFGPLRTRWVERRRATLPALAVCYTVLLTALAAGSAAGMGGVAAAVIGALAGAFTPPVGPPVRTVWGRLAADEALHRRALSLDTAAESAVFAAGPMLGGVLVALLSAQAALVLSAALALAGSSALTAVLRRPALAAPADPAAAAAGSAARRVTGPLRAPGFAALLLVLLGTGCALSMVEIAVVAAWGARVAGPLLALVPIGGITGGLAYGRRQWAAPPGQRLLFLAALCAASLALPAAVYSASGAGAGLLLAGGSSDALIVTAYLLVDALVGEGGRMEAGAWVNTAYNLGASLGSGTAGLLIDRARPPAALAAAAVLLAAVTLVGSLGPSSLRRRR